MRKESKRLPLKQLELNEGQLGWLPRNPRQWTQTDIDRTKASITEDPDFLEDRPVLVTPSDKEGRFVVFAHNLCTHSAKELAWKDIPAVIYYPESDDDHLTIKRRAIKDNGSYGSNDYDILANEWDDMPLADWGMPSWVTGDRDGSGLNLSTKGREGEDTEDNEDEIMKDAESLVITIEFSTLEQKHQWTQRLIDEKIKIRKGLNWRRGPLTEHLCDLNPLFREYKQRDFNYTACFHNTIEGEPLSVIKKGDKYVGLFAEMAISAMSRKLGGNYKNVQLVSAPARKHKDGNFTEKVCRLISQQTGILYDKSLVCMKCEDRFHPEFYLSYQVTVPVIVIYDDIVTTGKTITELHRLFEDKEVHCVIGIENDKPIKRKQR